MLTPQTLDALPDELISLIDELQTDIIKSIANKITKADYLTPSAEWQLYKAAQLRMSTKEITELLAKHTGKSKREIRRLYTEACKQAINEDAKIYRSFGKDASSFTRSVAFSNALKAGIKNADGMMSNFTKSMVQSSRKTVTHLMDKAYLKVLSGAFSPQEAIYSAVAELAAKGIQSVTYPSGRTDWADVAIRRAVITGIGQTTGRMQLDLAEEMGCDLVEVTSHMGARPSHAEWQGKVYSISGKSKKYLKLSTATGYGTGAGLKGWNCRHDFYPFFEGISERASFPIDKAENAKEYELSQKQRAMERAIRKSKRGLAALNESINSTDNPELKAKLQSKFDRSSATLKYQEQCMKEFCEANDLIVRNDRVRVVGFGKGVSQKAVHGSKRYVKKQSGGSVTSKGTTAKKSRAEILSKDKLQVFDYPTRKNGKPELIKSAGVDKSGGSGIIKTGNKLAEKKEFSFDDYDNVINPKSVERFKNTAKKLGYKYINGVEKLTDGRIARKILIDIYKLSKQYGKRFSIITIMDFGDEKTIAETLLGELRLNSKFMNKPDAIRVVLNQWEKDNFIPKGCNTIQYVSKHEYFHLLSQDAINKEKSKIKTEIKRNQLPPVSANAKKNVHEYVADLMVATKLTLKQQKLRDKIFKIIKEE